MKMICLVGASSSGKDLIKDICLRQIDGLMPIISHTTRPMRKGEEQGIQYYFINIEAATDMLNNDCFIETRQYRVATNETWLYGISKDKIDLTSGSWYIAIVDLQGLKKMEKYLDDNGCRNSLTSIFINTNYQVRLKRALQREGSMNDGQVLEVVRRFYDDIEFVDIAQNHCDVVLDNNDESDLVNIVMKIKEIFGNE